MKCKACHRKATRGIYCSYHRNLYNERVMALRAGRKENGECIMCGSPRSPESQLYCVTHMLKEAKRQMNPDVSVNGTLRHLLKKRRVNRDDLREIKRHFAVAASDSAFRAGLNDIELWILENRVLKDENKSLRQAGAELGVSYEWIRKVEVRLAEKLRGWLLKLNMITPGGKIIPR